MVSAIADVDMNETFLFLLLAGICLLIGAFIGNLIARLKSKSETVKLEERLEQSSAQEEKLQERFENTRLEREAIRKEKDFLNTELTKRNSEFDNLEVKLREQKNEVEKLQEKFTNDFEVLANKILENKSEKFTKQNKENIDGILKPLQDKIEKFESKVVNSNKESFGRHEELKEQLRNLSELNSKISQEADNLTKALKGDSKVQGNWGEMILSRVLEESGLEKGREYTTQDSHDNPEGGRVQTDVIVHLPDGKKMIIDSKVSFTDFERYVSEEDENLKKVHLKKHIESIKRHILDLSEKKYHHVIDESPDTIFMFVPIEPAFALAVANQPNLYQEAFKRKVMIVTPSTLLMALRLVENLWENDNQKKNTIEIATEAGRLHDSFVNLLTELEKINKQLGTVQGTFNGALTKLKGKGNLIRKVEKLKKLGAITNKVLDQKLLKKAEEENED